MTKHLDNHHICHGVETVLVRDVIIIGAGPCGLAVAARLCEQTPSALFTDEEHARYHWIRKQSVLRRTSASQTSTLSGHHGPKSVPDSSNRYDTLVLDTTANQWLARWNQLFETFSITHLRSPMFFHVDPADRDGLLAYAHERDMVCELKEIRGCVGKEISKHRTKKRTRANSKRATAELTIDERDRQDYYTPSQQLFTQHCGCVIKRYGLQRSLIKQERVTDISFGFVNSWSNSEQLFILKTDQGIQYARTIVLAVGAGNRCTIPCCAGNHLVGGQRGICHSMHITDFPSENVKSKIEQGEETNVVVVGGGLTAAQLADLAIRRGVTRVWMLVRSELKVKPFDVDLAWMGKFKNHEKSVFWSADSDEERLEHIRLARNGGSITPPYHKLLKSHIASNRLSLQTHTILTSRTWNPTTQTWQVTTDPPLPASSAPFPPIDYIYYATGTASDIGTLPYLQSLHKSHPIQQKGGLPCLTDDLMWREDVPLFVTGKFAGLRLGPGAGNLEGARMGAERVVWGLEEVLGRGYGGRGDGGGGWDGLGEGKGEGDGKVFRYYAGIGDRYEVLRGQEGDEDVDDEES